MNVGEFVDIDSTGLRRLTHFGTKRSPLAPDVQTAKGQTRVFFYGGP